MVRAAAGQTLSVTLKETNPQNYFNVLPPGSKGNAMFVGDTGEDYTGMLPSDGDYVVRVYLMRPAARRGESSDYTLTIGVTGKPLAPFPAAQDALVSGTSYHATAKIKCVPAYETKTRDCDASVIRRGLTAPRPWTLRALPRSQHPVRQGQAGCFERVAHRCAFVRTEGRRHGREAW